MGVPLPISLAQYRTLPFFIRLTFSFEKYSIKLKSWCTRAVSLAVERLLHTQEVTGSNPVPRKVFIISLSKIFLILFLKLRDVSVLQPHPIQSQSAKYKIKLLKTYSIGHILGKCEAEPLIRPLPHNQ